MLSATFRLTDTYTYTRTQWSATLLLSFTHGTAPRALRNRDHERGVIGGTGYWWRGLSYFSGVVRSGARLGGALCLYHGNNGGGGRLPTFFRAHIIETISESYLPPFFRNVCSSFEMRKVTDEELNGAAAALLGLQVRNSRWAREREEKNMQGTVAVGMCVCVFVMFVDDDAGRGRERCPVRSRSAHSMI